MAKDRSIRFGPPIPVVPVRDFSKIDLSHDEWAKVWRVCGPTIERNMQGARNRRLELWQVMAAAYLEGLSHGYDLATSKGLGSGSDDPEPLVARELRP